MDIALTPIDLSDGSPDREELIVFLTSNEFPHHVKPRPTRVDVEKRLADGDFGGEDHQAFWVDVAGVGRVGLVVLDDLADDAPLFDLRLAEAHRGRGIGLAVLRAITAHVFTTMPTVNRFEGQTREDNLAMRTLFLRAGFLKEAHYREGWPVAGASPVASVAYGILRRDWETGTTTTFEWEDVQG